MSILSLQLDLNVSKPKKIIISPKHKDSLSTVVHSTRVEIVQPCK